MSQLATTWHSEWGHQGELSWLGRWFFSGSLVASCCLFSIVLFRTWPVRLHCAVLFFLFRNKKWKEKKDIHDIVSIENPWRLTHSDSSRFLRNRRETFRMFRSFWRFSLRLLHPRIAKKKPSTCAWKMLGVLPSVSRTFVIFQIWVQRCGVVGRNSEDIFLRVLIFSSEYNVAVSKCMMLVARISFSARLRKLLSG
jgi:hypothetical protein